MLIVPIRSGALEAMTGQSISKMLVWTNAAKDVFSTTHNAKEAGFSAVYEYSEGSPGQMQIFSIISDAFSGGPEEMETAIVVFWEDVGGN